MKAKSERMAAERTDFWALAEHVRDTAIADRLLRRGDILARITEKETLRAIKDDLNALQTLIKIEGANCTSTTSPSKRCAHAWPTSTR